MDNTAKQSLLINSTAGAVPVRNEKGEIYMQKVKVARYITGKRPDFAASSSDSDSDVDPVSTAAASGDLIGRPHKLLGVVAGRSTGASFEPAAASDSDSIDEEQQQTQDAAQRRPLTAAEKCDPRLQRLLKQRRRRRRRDGSGDETGSTSSSDESEAEQQRQGDDATQTARSIVAPQIVDEDSSSDESDAAPTQTGAATADADDLDDHEDEDSDLDDDEVLRRRQLLRERALDKARRDEEELMEREGECSEEELVAGGDQEEEESSEYEEYTDSEEETGPRLKPVFIRKDNRVTIQEKEREALKQKQAEIEAKKMAEERRKDTLKMVESDIRREQQQNVVVDPSLAVDTDDEANDEAAYQLWKVRELRRIKRDKDERDALERDNAETERLRNMTEEERRAELRANPRQVTNRQVKGKYKFLQKYYHRGAFYLQEEKDVLKRDISGATLEDKFDKTVLPKVMQVKNFGRSGRTKYTHLVDQDTTVFDSAWTIETGQNAKFFMNQAGGMRQQFERPAAKKKRLTAEDGSSNNMYFNMPPQR